MPKEELAIEGGSPIIDTQIPSGVSGPSVVCEEEIAAVSDLLRANSFFGIATQVKPTKWKVKPLIIL